MIDPPVMVVVPVYVFALPRINTPPPALVMFWEPLMTPERMPAVIIVPVLPLLLTVMVRAAVPRLMLLVISVSPSAVPEPSTSEVGAKPAVVPQVRSALAVAPTPSDTTKRAGVPAAKPAVLAKETVPVPATEAARERVSVDPPTSNTPPLSVIGLLVGIPTTVSLTIARSWPPLMVVMPV